MARRPAQGNDLSGRDREEPAQRFRTTRRAHRDETAEDYVEAIAEIIDRCGTARVRDLTAMMGVSHVTVTRIINRLADKGLVRTAPYRPIELTDKGRSLADRTSQRHAIVLAFLQAIGVPSEQAVIDAEGIEHHVSDATIKAMCRLTDELAR